MSNKIQYRRVGDSAMSIDMNHFVQKRKDVRHDIAYGGLSSRSPQGGGEEAHHIQRHPHYAASFSLSSSDGLLSRSVRIGLLLLQSRCCASFRFRSSTLRNFSQS